MAALTVGMRIAPPPPPGALALSVAEARRLLQGSRGSEDPVVPRPGPEVPGLNRRATFAPGRVGRQSGGWASEGGQFGGARQMMGRGLPGTATADLQKIGN